MHTSTMRAAIAVVVLGWLGAVCAQHSTGGTIDTGGVDVAELQLPDIDALGDRTEVMTCRMCESNMRKASANFD